MTVITEAPAPTGAHETLFELNHAAHEFLAQKARLISLGEDCTSAVLTFVEHGLPNFVTALQTEKSDGREEILELLDHLSAELAVAVRPKEYLNDPDLMRKAMTLASLANTQAQIFVAAANEAQNSGAASDAQYAINALGEYEDRFSTATELLSKLIDSPRVRVVTQKLLDHRDLVSQFELGLGDLLARIDAKRLRRNPL